MRAIWKALSLRHRFVFAHPIKIWALVPAWFAMSLAVPAALAQAPSVRPAAAAAAPAAEEQPHAASPGGPRESIKVHGHWVIEVRNPDGSLAQHREFENSLQRPAGQELAALLLGNAVPIGWKVVLSPETTGTGGPCGSSNSDCLLEQQAVATALGCAAGCSNNLTGSNAGLANGGQGGITLSGWIQASKAGNIGNVETYIYSCGGQNGIGGPLSSTSPAQCASAATGLFGPEFTSAKLPATSSSSNPCGASGENSCEITGILAKQMINVSVTITFQ
jgi:hypothetical protein